MIQPHNRHISFSIYISALAVTDTIALVEGTEIGRSLSFSDLIKHEKQNHKTINLHLLEIFISMRLEYLYLFTGFILYLNQVHKIVLPNHLLCKRPGCYRSTSKTHIYERHDL